MQAQAGGVMAVAELFLYLAFAFLAIRFFVVLSNVVFPSKLPKYNAETQLTVDVLIPARNEEHNIGGLLADLVQESHAKTTILVYDDLSTDRTAEVVSQFAERHSNVKLISGEPLPDGWSGKNHACFQLANRSRANVLVFLDADVRVSANFVEQAVAYLQQQKLKLLSFFPVQQMRSNGEKMVVPLMNWILISLLPLKLIKVTRVSSFAAANGQCMIFDAENYRENQWHKLVKERPVEDIAIIKRMKNRRFRVATLLGNGEIVCRMYSGYVEAMAGLARSAPAFFANNIVWALVFIVLVVVPPVFLLWKGLWLLLLLYSVVVLVMRVLIAKVSQQSVCNAVVYHLPQMVLLPLLVGRGFFLLLQRQYSWKGRNFKKIK
ncbi:MAG: glycosyltransferase family 2 protein [Salinivirgaceae bacterium]|nr:glycosyltransferase family 2 protein [Salinivirgaceae bacterium]